MATRATAVACSWSWQGGQPQLRLGAVAPTTSGGRRAGGPWPRLPSSSLEHEVARAGAGEAASYESLQPEVEEERERELISMAGAGALKTLLNSKGLYKYILDTSVFPREPDCMRDLRLLTDKLEWGAMQSTPDGAQLLGMLIKMSGARKTIEVWVFTGYSLLATALALPEGGKVVAIDIRRSDFDLGLPFIQRAGVAHKVDFREGPALDRLGELIAEADADGEASSYDFAFVDADKQNYVRYHEQLLRLVRVGGTIVYDNTLWGGTVAMPPGTPMSHIDKQISAVFRDFNAMLAADPRIDLCQLTIADGVTICRRIF